MKSGTIIQMYTKKHFWGKWGGWVQKAWIFLVSEILNYTFGKYLVGGSFLGRFDFRRPLPCRPKYLVWGGWSKMKSGTKM